MSKFPLESILKVCRGWVAPVAFGAIALASCADKASAPSAWQNYHSAVRAVVEIEPALVKFRQDIHRHPELAGNERRTSSKVAEKLTALGYDVQTGVGGYGVVGFLKGSHDGPMVAFRSDMDAVAGDAIDPVPYASVVERVHHTCGHDIHTAIGIGLAEGFAAIQDDLPGSVMLIFQPAEEAGIGAEAMLAETLFKEQTPQSIFSVHSAPFEVGEIAVKPGGMLAGRIKVDVSLRGGGDIEKAELVLRDALTTVGNVTYEEMLSFRTDRFIFVDLVPQSPANDQEIKIEAYVMSAGLSGRARVKAALVKAVGSVEFEDVEVTLQLRQALEGVNNDAGIVGRSAGNIGKYAPEISNVPVPGVIPAFSEDFGSFQRSVPGVMYYLGVSNREKGTVGFPHSPHFVADDGAILVGIKAMMAAMIEELYLEVE